MTNPVKSLCLLIKWPYSLVLEMPSYFVNIATLHENVLCVALRLLFLSQNLYGSGFNDLQI